MLDQHSAPELKPLAAAELKEARRLEAIRRWRVLDTPPDGFAEITAIAARIFDVPFAVVCVVDSDQIWLLAHVGLDVDSYPRAPGLCCSVVETGDPLFLADARLDPVAATHPLVTGEPGLRFYAGAPLQTADHHHVGTLAVFDRVARETTPGEQAILAGLAKLVVREFEVRLAARVEVSSERSEAELERAKSSNLQQALGSHGTIGQAMGILMAQRGYPSDVAFTALRQVSQKRNIKLAEVARNLVDDFDLRARARRT